MKFYTTSRLSENILTTPEGYLVCVGVPIARTGEMLYGAGEVPIDPGPDGKIVIVRNAEEVFRPETIRSFEGKPVTILHPKDLVSPESWNELANGIMQNVRRGQGETENDLVADLLITAAEAIDLVKAGLREVSCGYEADYYQLGVGRGEQKNIIGNHLALVTQGRAGSSYAINDHKGKGPNMKLSDILAALKGKKFPKAEVEALRAVANDAGIVEEKKDEPAKDGTGSYDELCKAVKDLAAKVDGMGKAKDAAAADVSTQPSQGQAAKVEAKDDEVAPSLEERMKKLEEMVASLVSKQSGDAADEKVEMEDGKDGVDEDVEEETEDGFGEEEETDDAEEEKKEEKGKSKTGDAGPGDEDEDEDCDEEMHSRAEILAPGIKKDQKNLKAKAIKTAYGTKDGKAAIDMFTNGKVPDLKNEKFVDAVFIGVSEILKGKRTSEFSKTKTFDFQGNLGQPEGAMTPEKINELNAKHWAKKQ